MKKRAILFIVIAGIMWGTSGLFSHALSAYGFTPLQMTALRGSVAFVCMLAFVLLRRRAALRAAPRELLLYAGIAVALFGTAACYFLSMQMTSVATAVVLMYTAPIYVLIFSVVFLGERLSIWKLIGIGGMLLGCCFVSGIFDALSLNLPGILFGVLAGISYGAYNILTKIAMRQKCAPLSTTLYGFFGMSVIALSLCRPLEIFRNTARHPALLLPLILALGVFTYVIPYVLYTLGMRELPAGTASALGIVEPMSATLFGIFLLEELVTVLSVVGIVLILGCVLLLSRPEPEGKNSKNEN